MEGKKLAAILLIATTAVAIAVIVDRTYISFRTLEEKHLNSTLVNCSELTMYRLEVTKGLFSPIRKTFTLQCMKFEDVESAANGYERVKATMTSNVEIIEDLGNNVTLRAGKNLLASLLKTDEKILYVVYEYDTDPQILEGVVEWGRKHC